MVVKNNMSATNTLNTLNKNHSALQKSLQKVSSGLRITSAGDDSSGYAIAERMAVQMRSLDQDNKNAQNGNSMMKVAEGAVANTVEILSTLKEKVLNAANDTNTDSDRQQIQKELNQMIDQIDDNANVTYNGKYLVDGSHNKIVKTDPRAGTGETGTFTHLTNRSFSQDVGQTTRITDLTDCTGRNLGIQIGDTITVSWVKKGETQIVTYPVKQRTAFHSLFTGSGGSPAAAAAQLGNDIVLSSFNSKIGTDSSGNDVYTPDYLKAVTYRSAVAGVDNQISGLTISVTDSHGNINKSANAVLDNFEESIRAENESPDNAIVLQTGTKANQAIKVGFSDMRSYALGLKATDGTTLNISTQKFANAAVNVLDMALQKCLNQQTTIGAVESRLEYTSANIVTGSENTQASMSTMRDADMAMEMTEYTKNNVLLQAAQSMLAQANQNSS
ncbi:MAG: flagellin, partial [Selenomonadaceae bacterium]|nr:flagellin [Selenomonadaceae bacterium]